jgi:hypothetical protein
MGMLMTDAGEALTHPPSHHSGKLKIRGHYIIKNGCIEGVPWNMKCSLRQRCIAEVAKIM